MRYVGERSKRPMSADCRFPTHFHHFSQVLIIQSGRVEMDVFNDQKEFIATTELRTGDVAILLYGGHGFRIMEENTRMLEVKQGPFTEGRDKELF